jgi:hypothetical protein
MERHELETVIYEKAGPIARIILNRPEKANAGDVAAWRQENRDNGYGTLPREVAAKRAELAADAARARGRD